MPRVGRVEAHLDRHAWSPSRVMHRPTPTAAGVVTAPPSGAATRSASSAASGGRLRFTAVADHAVPLVDGGALFPGEAGLIALCGSCHSGVKRALENHARRTGQMDELIRWCDEPESRPRHLRGY